MWMLQIKFINAPCEITFRWMPHNTFADKSTLQVMDWCRQATSHYLSRYCLSSVSLHGVNRSQWINLVDSFTVCNNVISGFICQWGYRHPKMNLHELSHFSISVQSDVEWRRRVGIWNRRWRHLGWSHQRKTGTLATEFNSIFYNQ